MINFVNTNLIETSNKDPQNKLHKKIIYDFSVSLLLNINKLNYIIHPII